MRKKVSDCSQKLHALLRTIRDNRPVSIENPRDGRVTPFITCTKRQVGYLSAS